LNNLGGGLLNEKQTKRQVKIDAVERALEEMEQGAVDEVEAEVAKRLAAAVRLKKLNAE
jgi:isopentenyl phosphate kinase